MLKDLKLNITFLDHDGSLVPKISSLESEHIQILDSFLRNNAVEVLNTSDNSIIIYTKLYSYTEMKENNVIDYHPGYNIRSFFLRFKELIRFIDRCSYYMIRPFLSEDEIIDDLFE
jgi:hypothetical protein